MLKRHLLIAVSLFLLATTTEFLWMESLAGKEDLFEVQTEFGSGFEEKAGAGTVKFKITDFGLDYMLPITQVFHLSSPFHTQGEHPINGKQAPSGLKLYDLYCQLKYHC